MVSLSADTPTDGRRWLADMASNRIRSVSWSSNSRILSPDNVSVSKRKIFRPPKSVQEKVLCYSLCFLFVTLMVFLAALCIIADRWKATLSKLTYTYLSEDVCDSEACQESAEKLLSSLDPTTDPCVDFYQYACGGWMEKNPIPQGDSVFMAYDIRTGEVRDTVVDLLTGIDRNGTQRPKAVGALGTFFRACRDEESRRRVGVEPLSRLLREFGGWPMVEGKEWKEERFSWHERVARANRDLFLDMIVDLSLTQSVLDAKNYVLFLRRGEYLFEEYFLPLYENPSSEPNVSEALLDSIVQSARVLGSKLDTQTLRDEARKLVVFEFGLTMVGRVEDDFQAFEVTLGELDGNLSVPLENSPDFSYKQFLNLHLRSEASVDDQTSVYIQSLTHFIELPRYLEKVHPRHVANYISYWILHTFAVYTVRDLWSRVFRSSKDWSSQKACVSISKTFMSQALSRLYVDKYLPPLSRYHVNKMVDMIRLAYSSTLDQNTWMDKSTMLYSLIKLQSMESLIGYPEWIADDFLLDRYYRKVLDIKEDDYFGAVVQMCELMGDVKYRPWNRTARRNETTKTSSITVNAFYLPRSNFMVLPAGILGYPFYKYNRIDSINYGGIGTVIGHEISHGFDDFGSRFDHAGNLKNWWTKRTKEKFLEKARCFADQYDRFLDQDDPMRVDGNLTLSENIADNGAVRNAFKAFRLHLALSDEDMNNRKVLPGLPATPEQLFFLGYASVWCANMTDEYAQRMRDMDEHSSNKLRVNVPLANFIEFARAFKCKPGTPMNPRHKCILW